MIMDRKFLLFVLISLICASANGQIVSDLSCSNCLHLAFNITNVPSMVKTMIESLMSGIKLANPDCVSGNANVQQCPAPSRQSTTLVNRCQVTNVHLKAVGMRRMYPNAVMEAVLVLRGCIKRKVDQPNTCIDFADMDPDTKAKMTLQLKRLEGQWNSANYTGQMCIEGGAGSTDKPLRTTQPPAGVTSSVPDVTEKIVTTLSTLESVTTPRVEITTKKSGPASNSPYFVLSNFLFTLSLFAFFML